MARQAEAGSPRDHIVTARLTQKERDAVDAKRGNLSVSTYARIKLLSEDCGDDE